MHIFHNPMRDEAQDTHTALTEPLALHRILPGYAPTSLIDVPELAKHLGVGRVSVKDEAMRLGLPSFKILGASYAVFRVLAEKLGVDKPWASLEEWRNALEPLRPCMLTTATDGNHGRAVAYMARILGLGARIYVPRGTAQARIDAIASEGAEVVQFDGSYDQAVARAAQDASQRCLLIADTALEDTDPVPGWVIDGYSTMFNEIDQQLDTQNTSYPDVICIQMGVGALATACLRHYRQAGRMPKPYIIGVEPELAACVFESLKAGRSVNLPGIQHSIMAGLNCGTPSPLAWPVLTAGLDLALAIEDEWACEAMRTLAETGIVSGESGAAGLAGLLALVEQSRQGKLDFQLPLRADSHVLCISTEGATDPEAYAQIVGLREERV